jgi:UDP-N-acetyl-2-amino-2-deoxyglucuronate dehydrogenase
MKNFALIGAAGFIAPRHLDAIKKTGNNLILAYDPNDSVGVMDSYFPHTLFYKDFDFFVNAYDEMMDSGKRIDYVSICTPNYLHAPHMEFALRRGAHAICEKPLLLNTKDFDRLKNLEIKTGKKINTILQLRVHEAIVNLKKKIDADKATKPYDIELIYLTSRGPWYHQTWKADPLKSGGVTFNIGIHFFDMLTWIFGKALKMELHQVTNDLAAGYLELEKARVKWMLSINRNYLPEEAVKANKSTFRKISINGESFEFSDGFTELHKIVYDQILSGQGHGLDTAYEAINLVEQLNKLTPNPESNNTHPYLKGLKI